MNLAIIKVDPVPEHYNVYVTFLKYKKAFTICWGAYLSEEVMDFAKTLSYYRCRNLVGDGNDEDDHVIVSFLTKEDAETFSDFISNYYKQKS